MSMALETKEILEKNSEASLKRLQRKEFHQNLQANLNKVKVVPDFNDIGSRSGVNVFESAQPVSHDFWEQTSGFNNKAIVQNEVGSWTFHPMSHMIQPVQMNPYGNQFSPVMGEHQIPYDPYNMCTQGFPYNFQLQDFQYFVVIDFEATCDKEKIPSPQEIIEFPSVIVNGASGELEDCFQTYVRPTCNQLLTDFCKDLTGIQQHQVDKGVTLSKALLSHDQWLESRGIKNSNFAVVTWSNWDCRVMLESECKFKNIQKPSYFNRWINLKVPFRKFSRGMNCSLKEAVEKSGLAWEGRPHCGLDDARNTARLLALMMRSGFKFSITSSLTPIEPEFPFIHNKSLLENKAPQRYNNSNNNFNHNMYEAANDVRSGDTYLRPLCYCGVVSSTEMVRKPGPKQGSVLFRCGNWTPVRGARCNYFEWVTTAENQNAISPLMNI